MTMELRYLSFYKEKGSLELIWEWILRMFLEKPNCWPEWDISCSGCFDGLGGYFGAEDRRREKLAYCQE